MEEIRKIGPQNEPTLVTCERGSANELVAKAIHLEGRVGKPFLVINCSALSRELAGVELFGSVKGAFTGAVDRDGVFTAAKNGPVFLGFGPEVMEVLMASEWPGNVRELRKIVFRGATFVTDGTLRKTQLLDIVQNQRRLFSNQSSSIIDPTLDWRTVRDQVQMVYLEMLMHSVGGDKAKAMEISGMARATLYEKLGKLPE